MSRNIQRSIYAALSIAVAVVVFCHADTCTDEELRHDVLEFLTTRCCGRVEAGRVLTNEIRFDGDTDRLACVLAEFAQTNDAQIAEWAMWQLEKYATSAQLPFLYPCATNPVLGKIAVESILRIEGVTSNSLEAAHSYLSQTNRFPVSHIGDRAYLCRDLLGKVFSSSSLTCYRSLVLSMVCDFQVGLNVTPNGVDMAIIGAVPDYQYSKRRLAVLRAVKQRLNNDVQCIVPTNHEAALHIDVYNFQTNYLTSAINELVAYPEANLPE